MQFIANEQTSDEVTLLLVTPGGSPDAAYKMGRYLQAKYADVSMLIPGYCKSAGTLLAIAANRLVFTAYGELGPLDVQMVKTDQLAGLDSGLNISEAFMTLEKRAREQFHKLVFEIIAGSGGVVSFQTASHSAAEIVSSLYGPIFGKMDPEEVGSRARAMRIGEDYGLRLNRKFSNLKPEGIETLSQTYSSHGFVIDMEEASMLFQNVREANEDEKRVVDMLGKACRHPQAQARIENITDKFLPKEQNDVGTDDEGGVSKDAGPNEDCSSQRKPASSKKSGGSGGDTKSANGA